MNNAESDLRTHFRHEVDDLPGTSGLADRVIARARVRRRRIVAAQSAAAVAVVAVTSAAAVSFGGGGAGRPDADPAAAPPPSSQSAGSPAVGRSLEPEFTLDSWPLAERARAVAQGTVARYDLTLLPHQFVAAGPARSSATTPLLGRGACQKYVPDPEQGAESTGRNGTFCVFPKPLPAVEEFGDGFAAEMKGDGALLTGSVNDMPAFAVVKPGTSPSDETGRWYALYIRPDAGEPTVLRFSGDGLQRHDFEAFVSGLYLRPAGKRPLTGPI